METARLAVGGMLSLKLWPTTRSAIGSVFRIRKNVGTNVLDGFLHLAQCLVKDPTGCEYALRFDSGDYCYRSGPASIREGRPALTNETVSRPRRPPDVKKCRTKYLGDYLPFSVCLMEQKPVGCEHLLRCGDTEFCIHPDRRSFEKTRLP